MQLPVVVFRRKDKLFVTEYCSDLNFERFVDIMNILLPDSVFNESKSISKETLSLLCNLASCEKDKKLI